MRLLAVLPCLTAFAHPSHLSHALLLLLLLLLLKKHTAQRLLRAHLSNAISIFLCSSSWDVSPCRIPKQGDHPLSACTGLFALSLAVPLGIWKTSSCRRDMGSQQKKIHLQHLLYHYCTIYLYLSLWHPNKHRCHQISLHCSLLLLICTHMTQMK
jgi:hypothetical protein